MRLVNCRIIKDKIQVHQFGLFSWEYNLLSLLAYIRVERYFLLRAHSGICCRSLFNISAEVLLSCTTDNREVSSAKSFTVDSMFSDKWFIYIRKKSGPRIDPCGGPTFTGNHSKFWPLSKALWNLFIKKLWINFSTESETRIDFNL